MCVIVSVNLYLYLCVCVLLSLKHVLHVSPFSWSDLFCSANKTHELIHTPYTKITSAIFVRQYLCLQQLISNIASIRLNPSISSSCMCDCAQTNFHVKQTNRTNIFLSRQGKSLELDECSSNFQQPTIHDSLFRNRKWDILRHFAITYMWMYLVCICVFFSLFVCCFFHLKMIKMFAKSHKNR